eukprot:CAMPEP_0204410262 /NCGR_PEP_ID=MMETSP0470-20130426/10625_1 /ASSEMBLY_ACC=CAM_ASM_000385 /TAXON_ID=2969 /ORGANISM="Oxyrrhis marina" /LENGTH=88 /DNA_ID=CAMNT_0051406151 /DNA_START=31 /DNA_END=297 /DNA_ORIENTATION=+
MRFSSSTVEPSRAHWPNLRLRVSTAFHRLTFLPRSFFLSSALIGARAAAAAAAAAAPSAASSISVWVTDPPVGLEKPSTRTPTLAAAA